MTSTMAIFPSVIGCGQVLKTKIQNEKKEIHFQFEHEENASLDLTWWQRTAFLERSMAKISQFGLVGVRVEGRRVLATATRTE